MPSTVLTGGIRSLRRAWRRAWSTGATRVESAAVLRLVAAAIAAGVPVATMLDAWAEDSRGGQGTRLEQAARLLRQGATASEALSRVPRLVHDDHAVALAFGERTGLVGPVVRAALAGDDLLDPTVRREFRATVGYVAVVIVEFLLTTTWLAVRILPQFTRILDDMQTARPAVLARWMAFTTGVGAWLWLPACLAAGAAVVACSPAARGVVTRPFARPRRVTTALDLLAVAEACGRPVDEAARILAECQSDPRLAARLARVPGPAPLGRRLAAAGLVDAEGAALVDAAGGDTATALHAAAGARRLRAGRRRAVGARVIGTIAVLAIGALVLFQSLAVFVPLVEIIHALS